MRILLVEDNPAAARLTQEALSECDVPHEIHLVTDGEEATAFLKREGDFQNQKSPDLVLLDLNLPRKDGHEVLREIKTDPQLLSIPVIIISNSSSKEDICRVYQANGNCYLIKPPDLDQFFMMIRRLVEFWWHAAQLPTPHTSQPSEP